MEHGQEHDVIVVGSGTCGAEIARQLAGQGARVLVLERGGDPPPAESLFGMMSMADEVKVGKGLSTLRVLAAGGSSALYFGVVNQPPLDAFRALGVDLAPELDTLRAELPIGHLPDEMLGEQSVRLRDAAVSLGLDWRKHEMLIDPAKIVDRGYTYGALWKAKSLLDEAESKGVRVVRRARVRDVVSEGGRVTGVRYVHKTGFGKGREVTVRANRVVMAAGELATPGLLRASGLSDVGDRGFYCNPGYALYGLVPGLEARNNFVGTMGCEIEEGVELGDANVSRFLYKLMMVGKFKFDRLLSYPRSIGIGVKVKDGFGGGFTDKGTLHKDFSDQDRARLATGEREARRILAEAGATRVVNFGLTVAGRVGGLVRIGDHVDTNLETRVRGLYVCDGSIIPDAMRGTPTLTLLGFARRLSRHLAVAH